MAKERAIEVGDRVIHMQVPGILVVTGRRGALLEIEGNRGIKMIVSEPSVRRVDGAPPPPKE